MDERNRVPASHIRLSNGFTLIEITLAIFLLASALTIILGLQTSAVGRAIDDQNRLNAMLLARRVLTGIESGIIKPEVQETSVPALEFLPQSDIRAEDELTLQNFLINLKIEPWQIPGYDDIKVLRLFLQVIWGDNTDQGISIYYFLPENEEESAEQDEGVE